MDLGGTKYYRSAREMYQHQAVVVVVDTFNPSTQEAEAGGSLRVRGQPGLKKTSKKYNKMNPSDILLTHRS